jgi:hypothetical protein
MGGQGFSGKANTTKNNFKSQIHAIAFGGCLSDIIRSTYGKMIQKTKVLATHAFVEENQIGSSQTSRLLILQYQFKNLAEYKWKPYI